MTITSVCGGLKTLRKDHRDVNNNSAFVICTIIILVLVRWTIIMGGSIRFKIKVYFFSQFAILINASVHMVCFCHVLLKTQNSKLNPVGSTVRYEMMKLCVLGQYRTL